MYGQHPIDRLIQELIVTGREATEREIERIVERMATASFEATERSVPVDDRGARYQGRTLGARSDPLTYHLIKRVAIDKQWADGTTAEQYVADLRRAVRDPAARLAVYQRRGGLIAASVTPAARVLPPERQGTRPQPELLVIYSAERGIIISGYQFPRLENTGVPEEARWLR